MMLSVAMSLGVAWSAAAAPVFECDFERGPDLAIYEGLSPGDVEAEVVEPGADGTGHCLRARSVKPSRYCTVAITQAFTIERNLVLSFDYKAEIEAGKDSAYVACLFFDANGKEFFGSDQFRNEWRHFEVSLPELHPSNEGVLALGLPMERINLYARAKGDTEALMTLWLDNLRLEVRSREGKLSDKVRVSYANPPMFGWATAGNTGQGTGNREAGTGNRHGTATARLEYSREEGFPEGATVRVESERNFHTPAAALEPGRWYWRVWRSGELSEGWTDTEAIDIPEEAHRFMGAPVNEAAVAAAAHPRVIVSTAQPVGEDAKPKLIEEAGKLHEQGIPPDPPRYAEGNPEWPTWIDWYGKVHGGITSRAGGRLQRMGEISALTGDPQVREWTREMALALAAWDPKGGSAMDAGDIGAQHVLRGLCWAYDALHDSLTAEDAERLRGVIVTRAEQFRATLNPFRGGEANNHAWLKTLALGEAGLVLLGEHEAAGEWAEYARQLYVGRFLCVMGYQGDNNEGIAYWDYGLGFIIRYADMLKHTCGIDLYQHPWLHQTARFPMYCAPPGAWAISFADTGKPNHGIKGPACRTYVRQLALRTGDPYALWYSGATEALEGLEPKAPVDLPPSIHYRHIGWTIFHTNLVDGTQSVDFGMRSGPFYAGHQHDDQNGFVIHAYGEKLAIDSGYYDWYGSPHFTQYSTLTKAHNAILVNGEGQAHMQPGADGRIAAFFDNPEFGYTVGDASDPEVYQGKLKRFDRRVLFVKPDLFIIHDVLDSAQGPARYDWLLHTVAPIEADGQSFRLVSGEAHLTGRFVAPADLALKVTKGFPVEPVDGYSTRPVPPDKYVDEWTLTATPAQAREQEDFVTVLRVGRGPAAEAVEATVTDTATALIVKIGGEAPGTVVLRKRDVTGKIGAEGVETEGAVAAHFGERVFVGR